MRMRRPWSSSSQRTFCLAIFACAAGLLCFPANLRSAQQPAANAPELTLEQYRAELDRCVGAIQQPAQIRQLQDSLPPVWVVRAGENRLEVPTQPIRSQLQQLQLHSGSPEAARELRLLLNGMREEAEEMGRSQEGASPAKAQATLEEILRRKEFQGARGPSAAEILMSRISRWLVEKLARLFSMLHLGARTGNIIVWCVIALAFLALCYMAWKWILGWQPVQAAQPVAPSVSSDARQWIQEALAAAERGDYRAALHCAYWGAIARLEDLGRLSRDRARTPRESLRLLETQPGDHRLLHALTGIFERVWYGYRAASEKDWAGAKELLEKIGCLGASTAPTANS